MTPDGKLESIAGSESQHASVQRPGEPLSARERTIVRLMGHGLSNERIARQLSLAADVVKSHAELIFRKLEVRTRAQAVHRAWALGLIAPDQGMGREDEGAPLLDQRRIAPGPVTA
jgi:LuxR family maltose regulon positive regulatory protein